MEDFCLDHPVLFIISIFGIVIVGIFVVAFFNVNFGENIYTGYIYSAEDSIAKTTGHLRFSENAGMDEQPSFCVNKEDGQQLKELAGSGKKVRVIIPSGFVITAPWACAFPATIEEMGE